MSKKNIQISRIKDAYSLIEIVIAIAILGILMVIGALSYSNSMFTGNDAVRISDLERIKTALRNEKQKTWAYPFPGERLTLTASGLENPVAYQGVFDSKTRMDGFLNLPKDPVTGNPYLYSVRKWRQSFELAATMEEPRSYVVWDYLSAAPTILPSLFLAKEFVGWACAEIKDTVSSDCGDGAENRKKFIVHGLQANLPYDKYGVPVATALSFDAILSEPWVEIPGSPRYESCLEIRESRDYFWLGTYVLIDQFGNKKNVLCE